MGIEVPAQCDTHLQIGAVRKGFKLKILFIKLNIFIFTLLLVALAGSHAFASTTHPTHLLKKFI